MIMNMKTAAKIAPVLILVCITAAVCLFFLGAGESVTVYVTNSGGKYHRDTCSSLRQSKIAVSLKDAVDSGYEACAVCKPPVLTGDTNTANEAARLSGLYRVNAAGLTASAGADIRQMTPAEVTAHVDGDTVRVRILNPQAGLNVVETIRMLGVDTPETVHPNRQVEAFGIEASDFTKTRLLSKKVYLAFDWDLRDRYGRLLAYIYLADDKGPVCHNAVLIREGYAHAYTRFAFQFADEFRALEQEARREQRGLWAP